MDKLSKTRALILICFVPVILSVVTPVFIHSIRVKYMIAFLQALTLCLWYYNIFKVSNQQVNVAQSLRILTIGCLIFVSVSPLTGLLQSDKLSQAVAYLDVLGILFIWYTIPYSFSKALEKTGIQFDSFSLYVAFIVWPIAIWRYHQVLSEWKNANLDSNGNDG